MGNKNEELYETIPHLLYIYVRTLFCVNKYIVPNNYAFKNCSGITNITIGNGVTNISYQAFSSCSGLTSITSNAMTAPTIQNNTFHSVKTGGTLTVPSGSSGYGTWMQNANYYLGMYNWTKVEQ